MSKIKQKDAVFNAVSSVLKSNEFTSPVSLSSDELNSVVAIVTEGFQQGKIQLADTVENNEKLNNPVQMKKYVNGLIHNWLKKDVNLNGGVKYTAKNPGSRTGQGDEQLKTLKALKVQFLSAGDSSKAQIVEQSITKRVAEISVEKATAKVKSVNLSTLNPDLKSKLGL